MRINDSSDSEVVHKSKNIHRTRKHGADWDDDEDIISENSNDQYMRCESLFYEIFGTGDEYAYIYDRDDSKIETDEAENEINREKCYEDVKYMLPARIREKLSEKLMDEILEGKSAEYLAFYGLYDLNVVDVYYIVETIEEYKHQMNKGSEKGYQSKVASVPGLLSTKDYEENLRAEERINEPKGDVVGGRENYRMERNEILTEFKKTIVQISKNKMFIHKLNLFTEHLLMESGDETCDSTEIVQKLCRLYRSGENETDNYIRDAIIEEASSLVHADLNRIRMKLKAQGFVPPGQDEEGRIFQIENLQSLTNLLLSIGGNEGSYAGIFVDGKICKVVLVDEFGNLTKSGIFQESEQVEILNFVSYSDTVCISANTPNVRYLMQSMNRPVYYVSQSLSFFNDHKEYSCAYNIAAAVQNPAVYFSRLYYEAVVCNLPNSLQIERYKQLRLLHPLYKAIRMLVGTTKLDWINTVKYRNSYMLLHLLNLDLKRQYFNYENIKNLEQLKDGYDTTEFYNLGGYFILKASNNSLDKTRVHPVHYSYAAVLCKVAALHMGSAVENAEDAVCKVLESPSEALQNMDIPDENPQEYLRTTEIREQLLDERVGVFSGCTDQQIFRDLVGHLNEDEVYDGIIVQRKADYMIFSVNNANVYVRADSFDEYEVNQIAKVRVMYPVYHMLNYSGELVKEKTMQCYRFEKHRLFRSVDHGMLQHMMRSGSCNILLRRSSEEGYCVLVCKMPGNNMFSYRLREDSGFYCYEQMVFESIDTFIEEYVKRVYALAKTVTEFKYFRSTVEEARDYVAADGAGGNQYLRYAVCFSKEHSGYVEFLYSCKRVLVRIEKDGFLYRHNLFRTLEEFISFAKKTFI